MQQKVIILEDPAAALDPKHTRKVQQIVDRLTAKGITVLMATHDIDYACSWADEIVLMHEGRVLRQGPPLEVCSDREALKAASLEVPAVLKMHEKLIEKGLIPGGTVPPTSIDELVESL